MKLKDRASSHRFTAHAYVDWWQDRNLDVGLKAIDLLLPQFLDPGLGALDRGEFHSDIKAGDHTNRLPMELKKRFEQCLQEGHIKSADWKKT